MREINLLHPELQDIVEKLQDRCKAANLPVLITDTLRTEAEQNKLYAQGRTAPGAIVTSVKYPNSMHCWGVAFDFCRNVRGREYDDSDGFYKRVGEIGESLGLEWGGRWTSPVDKPHFQMKSWAQNSGTGKLVSMFGTPKNFMATWSKISKKVVLVIDDMAAVNKEGHWYVTLSEMGGIQVKIRDVLTAAGYTSVVWDEAQRTITGSK